MPTLFKLKKLYLALAGILGVFSLIILFQNIVNSGTFSILFATSDNSSMIFPIFFCLLLGMALGSMLTLYLASITKDVADKQEDLNAKF